MYLGTLIVSWQISGVGRAVFLAAIVLLAACGEGGADGVELGTTVPRTDSTTATPGTSASSTTEAAVPPCGEGPLIAGFDQGPGLYFACSASLGGVGVTAGRVFHREGVVTAEDALRQWLNGPTAEEVAAGFGGFDVTAEVPRVAQSVSFRREGVTLFMDFGYWEPIGNLSTSTAGANFIAGLLGTAFSDPTVEQFSVSITGDSCPVFIGEMEWCFPVTWEDFLEFTNVPPELWPPR